MQLSPSLCDEAIQKTAREDWIASLKRNWPRQFSPRLAMTWKDLWSYCVTDLSEMIQSLPSNR